MPISRNAVYSRYSTNDWEQSNRANFGLSERERTMAERLRSDAWQAIKATDTMTRNRQHANTRRLGELDFMMIVNRAFIQYDIQHFD